MKQGEIWLINLNPTIGAEIQKTRPAIIVNNDDLGILPLKIIVPITDWKEKYHLAPWMVFLEPNPSNGLLKESAAIAFKFDHYLKRDLLKKLEWLMTSNWMKSKNL